MNLLNGVDVKKAAFGAALVFVAYKGMIKNKTASNAALAVGAVVLANQTPVVNSLI